MSKIGLFYGTDTGNTERIADLIAQEIGMDKVDLHDVISAKPEDFAPYDKIILGQPTWYYGERQSSWDDFWEDFRSIDFTDKVVACFGLGDQADYAEYFVDAIGMMHDVVLENGGTPAGYWPTDGYEYDESQGATEDGEFFVGLALDEDQQPDLTDSRIQEWVAQLKEEMGF